MAYKIAVGSSDGKNVDLKFGEVTKFLIYEVGDEVLLSEEREFVPEEKADTACDSSSCDTKGCGGNGGGCKGPGDVADKAIEDAARETLRRDSAEDEDELDEFDDEFDEDEDDLKTITNLDQILDREGIDLNAEDPTLNILTMYGAGLSIIEISKVLKMGVGEVKYIIDSNTAN